MQKSQLDILRSSYFIAACDKTGISISLSIPTIPGFALEYQNPLASIDNCKTLAERKTEDLMKLPHDALAGIFLVLLDAYHLNQDHVHATQKNITLQKAHKFHLIESIKLFSAISKKNSFLLPKLSLDLQELEYSKINDIIVNYTKTCKDILHPKPSINSYLNKDINHSKEEKQTKSIGLSIEQKKEGKDILNNMLFEGEITEKFYSLIKTILQKDNFIHTDQNLKNKIIDKLDLLDSTNSNKLADILSTKASAKSSEEVFEDAISSSVPAIGKKLSLKEILAAKLQQKVTLPTVESNEEAEEETEEDEVVEYLPWKDLPEDSMQEEGKDNSDEF